MKIGFIGLGIMGRPMAKNLLKGGYRDLLVCSRTRERVDELVRCGAQAACYETVGRECGVVFTMLPNSPQVKEVMLGAGGVASFMRPGSVFIDMSSIDPTASREIAAQLAQRGVGMLDAPVSGGEPKAIDGTLSFMVGGPQELFERFKPVLETMGSSVIRCGEVGAGNTAKLANQIIVACNIQALAEALTLAQKANNPKAANIVAIGAMIKKCGLFPEEKAREVLKQIFVNKGKEKYTAMNEAAFMEGYQAV